MDEKYLLSAVRYVELNPVRAKIVPKSQGYRWSSARAHLEGIDDDLVKVRPMLDRVDNWSE
jgi:putative transposase